MSAKRMMKSGTRSRTMILGLLPLATVVSAESRGMELRLRRQLGSSFYGFDDPVTIVDIQEEEVDLAHDKKRVVGFLKSDGDIISEHQEVEDFKTLYIYGGSKCSEGHELKRYDPSNDSADKCRICHKTNHVAGENLDRLFEKDEEGKYTFLSSMYGCDCDIDGICSDCFLGEIDDTREFKFQAQSCFFPGFKTIPEPVNIRRIFVNDDDSSSPSYRYEPVANTRREDHPNSISASLGEGDYVLKFTRKTELEFQVVFAHESDEEWQRALCRCRACVEERMQAEQTENGKTVLNKNYSLPKRMGAEAGWYAFKWFDSKMTALKYASLGMAIMSAIWFCLSLPGLMM